MFKYSGQVRDRGVTQVVSPALSTLARSATSKFGGSGGNFCSRGRGGFGNWSLISGSNAVSLGGKKRPW
ncbi:hypothetical protein F3Y22_tig00112523pilonHSYRG00114 [Hibiscus syriacus]|uniref:Uncharacterized protein n=1 Tax=Hibiscus syriacus TaxID=106335 RepID=A0A6A2X9I3_HIBSY|nr:hypothetical protein F3Y22_tig00112523pilonHSYRG00114 [Hibiscus syriacus]